MKIIDKTPYQSEKGEMTLVQRIQGTLEHGMSWYNELEGQKAVIAQLDQVLEKGFTLIRNFTLVNSQIVEPLILVGPPGIYAILVTPLTGFYEAKGDQWNVQSGGRAQPARVNLMYRVARLARALQVYLNRQGAILPGVVEPILIASSPAMHVDMIRPIVRVVMSDAIKQFGASLVQARPMLRPEQVYDFAERIITPRPKEAAPAPEPEAADTSTPGTSAQITPTTGQTPARARAIFHAAEDLKPFDPNDLSFAFDENGEAAAGTNASAAGAAPQAQQRIGGRGLSPGQLILLGGMAVVECCVLAGFGFFIFSSSR